MTVESKQSPTDRLNVPAQPQPDTDRSKGRDLTGRSRLVSNVLFTWGAQMVFFVAGFVMPRMIDQKLGQEVLGVWDFSWSLVTYFRLVEMGITSSVNRHVAKFWAKQDIAGVNRVVSSATFVLLIAATVILLGTVAAVFSLPHFFGPRLKEHIEVAQYSVLFLGVMLAVGTALGAFNGVLTGCHRWELQSIRLSVWHFLTVTGMLVALWFGAGLVTLAAITAIGQTLGQLTMVTLSFRVCPGLRLRRSLVDWPMIRQLYVYSGKTLLPSVSTMLLNQTTSLMILGALGPAALAVFTRPRSLMLQIDSLERKMSMILIPTTSSLESAGDENEIRRLLVKSVRYSLFLVLPLFLVLVIFGGPVMYLWMGPDYANGLIPAILAFGLVASCVQTPVLSILEGLNAHGMGGVAQFVASLVSVGLAVLALGYFHAGLVGMAVAVTLPLMIVNLGYLPFVACRHVGQDLGEFFRSVAIRPLLVGLPFAICLVVGRVLYQTQLVAAVIVCLVGGLVLTILYWRGVLPESLKVLIRRSLAKFTRAVGFTGAGSAVG